MNKKTLFVLITLGMLLYTPIYAEEKETDKPQSSQQSTDVRLKTSYVCMMNNKYFGKEQIPVDVNGKIYYGCCQGCVEALKSNSEIRTGVDPLTGESVDKTDAYIVLKQDGTDEVYYFKSAENYIKYIQSK